MTPNEMVDEWSRMTPTQREFCARLVAIVVHPDSADNTTAVLHLATKIDFNEAHKEIWDAVDWPFKFGASA
jgi:hypothetical protein